MDILVVEDNELLLKAIEFRLKKEGYNITTSTDGKDALEKISNSVPDLIITDIMIPFFNGLEIVSTVRNKFLSKIPIIVLSRVGSEKTILEAFELGADDFITKPFSPNELCMRIKKLLIPQLRAY
ncbi:response regulator transcription factor [Telluribacter sp.]|jgi:DNA-binding response OmpR family regulator|uniref:response regulator transcription factor n=1 Tax=Telluribacter sp. TaxID=1978767 RepID=UPI002E13D312|nr:response regulator transcription factor [Telluribacter sp.]